MMGPVSRRINEKRKVGVLRGEIRRLVESAKAPNMSS